MKKSAVTTSTDNVPRSNFDASATVDDGSCWFVNTGCSCEAGEDAVTDNCGVKYIGGIKALTSGLMVFATASGTAVFGLLIDFGYSINSIAIFSAIYIVTVVLLLFFIRKEIKPVYT